MPKTKVNKVCAWCKKKLNDHEKDLKTSHGICDECLKEHFGHIHQDTLDKLKLS